MRERAASRSASRSAKQGTSAVGKQSTLAAYPMILRSFRHCQMQNTVSLFGIHAEAGPAFSFMISCLGAFFKGESNGLAGLGRAVAYTGVVAEGRTFHLSERAKGTHTYVDEEVCLQEHYRTNCHRGKRWGDD